MPSANTPKGLRWVVVGPSCSGKTTVARRIAACVAAPHIELDALHWTRPDWRLPTVEEFRARVDEATRGERWVADGNYSKVRDLVWGRADTVVWLDVALPSTIWRLIKRTWQRSRTSVRLWGRQQETLRNALFSRESLLLYSVRTDRRRRRTYAALAENPAYEHLHVMRLRGQRAIDRWLEDLERTWRSSEHPPRKP